MSSDAINAALRRVEELERLLNARESGLPPVVGVLVYSDDPDLVEEAISVKLADYGLSSVDELEQAGSKLDLVKLPFCYGRAGNSDSDIASDVMRGMGKIRHIVGSYEYLHERGVPGYGLPLLEARHGKSSEENNATDTKSAGLIVQTPEIKGLRSGVDGDGSKIPLEIPLGRSHASE